MADRDEAEAIGVRSARPDDAERMTTIEGAARSLLRHAGVDLDTLSLPDGFAESVSWDVAVVAEVEGCVVGMARCTDLGDGWLALDQVSVAPDCARRGVGGQLLAALADLAVADGYRTITGTTFRSVPFNAPFYAGLAATEDFDPHPAMIERRRVEQSIGLDRLGPRLVMRLELPT